MSNQPYYPRPNGKQVLWLRNFRNKLPNYQTTLGYAAGEITAAQADADMVIYVLDTWQPAVQQFAQAATKRTQLILNGPAGADPVSVLTFTLPATPAPPAPVAAGALKRLFAFIKNLKTRPGYGDDLGEDLGIVGAESTGPDFDTLQPVLEVKVSGNAVQIGWTWQGYSADLDAIEIQVDRGDGKGFVPLAMDTTPGYTDTAPLPAAPVKWTYRAIYRVEDAPVGLWSNPVSVTVG
jgi:hypothetical protein